MQRFYLTAPVEDVGVVIDAIGKIGVAHLTRETLVEEITEENENIRVCRRFLKLLDKIESVLQATSEERDGVLYQPYSIE